MMNSGVIKSRAATDIACRDHFDVRLVSSAALKQSSTSHNGITAYAITCKSKRSAPDGFEYAGPVCSNHED